MKYNMLTNSTKTKRTKYKKMSVPLQKEKESSWMHELIIKLTLASFSFTKWVQNT